MTEKQFYEKVRNQYHSISDSLETKLNAFRAFLEVYKDEVEKSDCKELAILFNQTYIGHFMQDYEGLGYYCADRFYLCISEEVGKYFDYARYGKECLKNRLYESNGYYFLKKDQD